MAANAINAWPQLGSTAPGAGLFEAIPTVAGLPTGPVQVLHHTLTAGLPHEYARLYLVITVLPAVSYRKVVLERAVLIVGPSHSQRSTSNASPPRDLAGAICSVLDLLDKLYLRRGGALCLRSPGNNIKVHGVLDAIVFTNFELDLDTNQAGGLMNLLFAPGGPGNSLSLLSYFKRQAGTDGDWKPCTRVYCRWSPTGLFGDQNSVQVSQKVESNVRYMVATTPSPQTSCKIALIRNRNPGPKRAGALLGVNTFNLGDQDGFQDMEKITKQQLIAPGAAGGLNVEEFPGATYSPRLYILPGKTAFSTVLVHNIGTVVAPRICLHYNVDDHTAWPAILHTITLCDTLELVSFAWGHGFVPTHVAERLLQLMPKTNPGPNNTRVRVIKKLVMQLIPLTEAPNASNHARYGKCNPSHGPNPISGHGHSR